MTLIEALALRRGDDVTLRPVYTINGRTTSGPGISGTVTRRGLLRVEVTYAPGLIGRFWIWQLRAR